MLVPTIRDTTANCLNELFAFSEGKRNSWFAQRGYDTQGLPIHSLTWLYAVVSGDLHYIDSELPHIERRPLNKKSSGKSSDKRNANKLLRLDYFRRLANEYYDREPSGSSRALPLYTFKDYVADESAKSDDPVNTSLMREQRVDLDADLVICRLNASGAQRDKVNSSINTRQRSPKRAQACMTGYIAPKN